ncbi:MAG: O-antigen ligase family protein [Lachnospiraceae bacterium]|nr:O-antigen ligase family protein [Lachnospiraceae bacterium]
MLYTAVMVLPFLGGLSRLFLLFFSAAVLCVALMVVARRNGGLSIALDRYMVLMLVIFTSAVVSFLVAIDKGDAFYGLMRIISAGLFAVLMVQVSGDAVSGRGAKNASTDGRQTSVYVSGVSSYPCLGEGKGPSIADYCVAMILICAVGYVIPGVRELVFSGGRLGGFFQYANTMALYIMIAIVVHLYSYSTEGKSKKDIWLYYGKLAIMVAGLLWTGSRTTLAMFALFMIWFGIRQKRYKLTAGIIGGTAAAAVLALAVFGRFSSFARIFTVGSYNSTFWGRFLYWRDAMPVILSHPFGLGYGGYMRLQSAIQTGVYVTRFIHNDYLQIALDHGLAAMIAFIILLLMAIVDAIKTRDELRALLLIIFAIHIGWDFDLQYYAITAILILIVFTEDRFRGSHVSRVGGRFSGRRRPHDPEGSSGIQIPSAIAISISAVFTAVFLWLGLVQGLMSAGDFRASFSLYPWDSVCEEQLMYYSQSEDEMGEHIDHILYLDPYSSSAWRMQAFRSSSYGDYELMIDSIDRYLLLRKYDMEAHSDMIVLLAQTADRIEKEGDKVDAKLLREHIRWVAEFIADTEKNTSSLAYRLRDLPEFTLSDEANEIVEMYK